MKHLQNNSYLFSINAGYIEELYALYLKNPASVSEQWQQYFYNLQAQEGGVTAKVDQAAVRDEIAQLGKERRRTPAAPRPLSIEAQNKQIQVLQLINAYRFRGHQQASFDPLQLNPQEHVPELDPAFHNFTAEDMLVAFNTGSLMGPRQATLEEILSILKNTYCGDIGIEYMHISNTEEKRWIQQRIESIQTQPSFDAETKKRFLERVIAAHEFEKYLHTRYVGQKRFSLEGAESLIPLMDELIQRAGQHKVTETVLGMAHRGRLNVLTNILGKTPSSLFMEFEGKVHTHNTSGSGDVKYHQGFSSDIQTTGGIVHLALSFNPSHLEIIGPVVQGSVRARQNRRKDQMGSTVLPILIHGDAAFAGQGVVMENFQMSEARGFTTGGTVHVIINNQIGFTTSNPLDARSTIYCTEVARMVQAPIFHVNGDDPEAVVFCAQLALDYRMRFRKDVVIDMVCYRRHGHSEADEPSATQPLMYKKIKAHPPISQLYAEKLAKQDLVSVEQIDDIRNEYRQALAAGDCVAPNIMTESFEKPYWVDWIPYIKASKEKATQADTTITSQQVVFLNARLSDVPDNITLHTQVSRILKSRKHMASGEEPMDWGFAENLAYASLVQTGYPVRISGQDSGRGTFFHRHAVFHDQKDAVTYIPLQHISKEQAPFTVIDSLLSEEAVLAFEFGYSTAAPYALVIWEAQFGDFANGAQVVIDQFISSSESKWGRLCGLVMLLPHGFDGQGPEHSSARLERYLQLCAEDNIQVVVPTLPAQMFHLLRRQVMRNVRKPLIVMSPKSLLRHKLSTSSLGDICERGFLPVIGEIEDLSENHVSKVILCSGKVYFDLIEARQERGVEHTAIIRLEQLYPFPQEELVLQLSKYENAHRIVWCQEEPLNQGAWQYTQNRIQSILKPNQKLSVVARPASASPAVGYYQKHIEQLHELLDNAFAADNVEKLAARN
ncbi:MAG: 2-oxoglutarate dehydrogenase E1 component [Gammaproteobacteria bacterium]|nr:2-oxoglutarate dehydrogenase E1 component [Gammaproteobacteria bacterium]